MSVSLNFVNLVIIIDPTILIFGMQEDDVILLVEAINILFTLLFLGLFAYRLHYLKSFSVTDKYKHYYPKLRIIFSTVYIVLSVGMIVYNLVYYLTGDRNQKADWYEEIFMDGGGETINSIILVIQLFVLRYELNKEQPYTNFHVIYFTYLFAISLVRFLIIILVQVLDTATNITLSVLLVVDSVIQLVYWINKKQSLPQFEIVVSKGIEEISQQSKLLSNRFLDLTDKSFLKEKTKLQNFPYIMPTVKIDKGKFRIILQIMPQKKDADETDSHLHQNRFHSVQQTNLNQIMKAKSSFAFAKLNRSEEIISDSIYTLEEIKRIYIICGRFSLKNVLTFSNMQINEMAQKFQIFLEELFREKRSYQSIVLKSLRISGERVKDYGQKFSKYTELQSKESEIDNTIGIKHSIDNNAIYISIQVFRILWIEDHFEFYIKAISKQNHTTYPMRRYSEFEQLHNKLRAIISSEIQHSKFELPQLPKKHLFSWSEDQKAVERKNSLQVYLKKLCNDYTIIQNALLRQKILQFVDMNDILHLNPSFQLDYYQELKITKAEISRGLVNHEAVTFYSFRIFRNGIEIRKISKRFSEFEELHHDLTRWMDNIQITYKAVALPEKHLYKSEAHRHQKLRNYLQTIIQIKQIGKLYSVNVFFNVSGDAESLDQSELSAIAIKSKKHDLTAELHKQYDISRELELQQSPPRNSYSSYESNKRFSQLMDDLGNDELD